MNEKEYYLILRRRKGIGQLELSQLLNCSQSLISKFENDDCKMSKDKIERYKDYIEKK
ncbi:helix-turn-helix transcriptional regulator [Ornithinibacillus massiliensis]|uniref:Helix-turn-helix transcriptional regulator n=1 Tax=Ornithinibacillus massiliensis TaxID=1944633 RepID=A0ABS5MC90_9BACI|nr:helix-turn-helix transcriptional regulator [Ornithinibacillus massiliensis]MBS3679945.1 helix-turn-helix transcriptional regulator [Ornithinibacillus massiliensis]